MTGKTKKTPETNGYSFASEQWDIEGWDKEQELISDMVLDFGSGYNTLEKYDLPRDLNTLKGYGEYGDPQKWTRYILSLYESYIGKLGYIPKPEKNRIREEYLKVAQETSFFITGLARAIAAGCPLVADNSGYVEVDEEKMREDAKPKFICRIDTKRMSDYWQKVVETAHACKALKVFEANNGLPPSIKSPAYATDIVSSMVMGNEDLDPRSFERYMWRRFVKPNKQ